MILLVHLLFGAAIGSTIKNIPLGIIMAFLSHYFLDFFPHVEYGENFNTYVERINKKQWRKMLPEILKVVVDFGLGLLLILIFSKNSWLIYVCALVAILPDGITIFSIMTQNRILRLHDEFHEKLHFLELKKISNFWRILSQAVVVVISIILFKL